MITETKFNLDIEIVNEINEIARKYSEIEKIVLFGSRARKDNLPKSDIDLAVFLNKTEHNLSSFIENIENKTSTLLEFDITNMNETNDDFFIEQIERDGITIYDICKNNTAYFITNSKSSQDYNLQLDLEE